MIVALVTATADWTAAGHEAADRAWQVLGIVGPAIFAVVLLAFLLRAVIRHRRYRLDGALGEESREAVRRAVVEVEKETVGEVLPVILERSDPHPGADWLAALCFLVVGTSLTAPWLPWNHPVVIVAAQLALGAAGFGLARLLPDFKRVFILEDRATEVATEQAFQEFYANGLHRTRGASGVLIFVSLLEHRAIVMADEGIAGAVDPAFWAGTDDLILDGARRGRLGEGLVAGIRRAGETLARHYPVGPGDRNEIPDRVILRRE